MPTIPQITQLVDNTTSLLTTVTEASSNINQASQVVTTAVSTHTAQPDPHGQYVQELVGHLPVFAQVDTTGRPIRTVTADGQVVGGGVRRHLFEPTGNDDTSAFQEAVYDYYSDYGGTADVNTSARNTAFAIEIPDGMELSIRGVDLPAGS